MWDLSAGDPNESVRKFSSGENPVNVLALSADGAWLATAFMQISGRRDLFDKSYYPAASDPDDPPKPQEVRIWNLSSPRQSAEPIVRRESTGPIEALTFSGARPKLIAVAHGLKKRDSAGGTAQFEENRAGLEWDLAAGGAADPVPLVA